MLRVNIQQYFLIVGELVGPVLLVELVGPVLLGVDRVGVPGPVRRLNTQLSNTSSDQELGGKATKTFKLYVISA